MAKARLVPMKQADGRVHRRGGEQSITMAMATVATAIATTGVAARIDRLMDRTVRKGTMMTALMSVSIMSIPFHSLLSFLPSCSQSCSTRCQHSALHHCSSRFPPQYTERITIRRRAARRQSYLGWASGQCPCSPAPA